MDVSVNLVHVRRTAFAGLTSDDTVEPQTDSGLGDTEDDDDDDELPPDDEKPEQNRRRKPPRPGVVTYQVPLQPGQDVVVEFPYAPTSDDFDFFVTMLQAVKARLVAQPDQAGDES